MRLDADPEVPTDARSLRIAAQAGLDALEGRRAESLAGYREVFRRSRDGAVDFDFALFVIDSLVALGPDEPELRPAADEAQAH